MLLDTDENQQRAEGGHCPPKFHKIFCIWGKFYAIINPPPPKEKFSVPLLPDMNNPDRQRV